MYSLAEKHLIKSDPLLGAVIKQNGHLASEPRDGYFESLTRSIISQQLSVKSASKIYARFKDLTSVDPVKVLELSPNDIKTIGLSGQKTRYLFDLSKHFIDNPNTFDHLENLTDEDVTAELTNIKGIGV